MAVTALVVLIVFAVFVIALEAIRWHFRLAEIARVVNRIEARLSGRVPLMHDKQEAFDEAIRKLADGEK